MAYGVIYKIADKTNGMIYIGQTIQELNARITQHKYGDLYVDRAIQKHGWENFSVEVLEECDTQEQLNKREIFWIAHFNCMVPKGYNRTAGGEGLASFSHTAETCEKIRKAQQGEKNSFFGRHHTKETRDEMSSNRKGRKLTPEQIAKSAAGNRGQKRSEESKLLMSKLRKGKSHSLEHSIKIGVANRDDTPFKNLSAEILKRQISYKTLAKLLGLSPSTVSNRMHGTFSFTAEEIAKLAKFFGLPAEYLMQRDENLSTVPVYKCIKAIPSKNLLSAMNEQQFSYADLAKFLELSPSSVSRKMSGKKNFTAKDIAKLVEIFGLPAEYLLECTEI